MVIIAVTEEPVEIGIYKSKRPDHSPSFVFHIHFSFKTLLRSYQHTKLTKLGCSKVYYDIKRNMGNAY